MAGFTKFVDMALDDDDALDMAMPIQTNRPTYPPNLCIALCNPQIEKLEEEGLDCDECEVGDTIDLRMLGRVTSVSDCDGPMGRQRRIEIQCLMLACEIEDQEEPGEDC
jgi:hypothetical protein